MSILAKLNTIQTKLKAHKGQRNEFGKYNYRSCEDILEALKPLLEETNTIVILSDEIVNIGNRYYVKVLATLADVETGDRITNTAFAREEEDKKGMDGSQITGASSSYARKYALNGLLAIDDARDSDVTNTHDKVQNTPKPQQTQQPKPSNVDPGSAVMKFGAYTGKTMREVLAIDRPAIEKIAKGTGKYAEIAQGLLQEPEF